MTLKRAQNTYKPQNINSIITLKGFDLRKLKSLNNYTSAQAGQNLHFSPKKRHNAQWTKQ